MAAPNLINATTIIGKTTGANLTSTSTTTVLNNPASSGKCLKVNTLNISNGSANSVATTISWHNSANSGGTAFALVNTVTVPAFSTLVVIEKTSQYYLEENTSISATAGSANVLNVTCSYEEIS